MEITRPSESWDMAASVSQFSENIFPRQSALGGLKRQVRGSGSKNYTASQPRDPGVPSYGVACSRDPIFLFRPREIGTRSAILSSPLPGLHVNQQLLSNDMGSLHDTHWVPAHMWEIQKKPLLSLRNGQSLTPATTQDPGDPGPSAP